MWPRVAAYPDLSGRHRFSIPADARVSKSGAVMPAFLHTESVWLIAALPQPDG